MASFLTGIKNIFSWFRDVRLLWSLLRSLLAATAVLVGISANVYAETDGGKSSQSNFEHSLIEALSLTEAPGATASIMYSGGRTLDAATGWADIESQQEMTTHSRLMSGSTGKTFVSAALLKLASEGQVDLDDPISLWLGEEPWFGELAGGDVITVRQLLEHTSGLLDHVKTEAFLELVSQASDVLARNPEGYISPLEAIACILNEEALFPPGTGYYYTDTGYLLLGLIIEKAAQQSFYSYVQDEFLTPLALNDTKPATSRLLPGLASGYLSEGNHFNLPSKIAENATLAFNPAGEWTGGGFVTTARDLAAWAYTLYTENAFSGAYLAELLRYGYRDGSQSHLYSIGTMIIELEDSTYYGHSGYFPGYNAVMYYSPKHNFSIAIQTNSSTKYPATQIFPILVSWAIENLDLSEQR